MQETTQLRRLNIGCGHSLLPAKDGWTNLDCSDKVGADIVFDLNTIEQGFLLPYQDETFDFMLMSHVLEHLPRPLPIMEELWRVAKHGCELIVRVPYGSSDIAFEDPTHYRQYFLNSFSYFGQPAYARADYGYRGDWQEVQRVLVIDQRFPPEAIPDSPEEFMQMVNTHRNVIEEFIVVLKAVPLRNPADGGDTLKVPTRFGYREDIGG